MNEKQIITELLKIAQKQQKVIHKLADIIHEDPNLAYLRGAIPVAAVNAGMNNVIVSKVETQENSESSNGATLPSSYIAYVKGIVPKRGEAFMATWNKQLATQKPDLVGRVSIIFE